MTNEIDTIKITRDMANDMLRDFGQIPPFVIVCNSKSGKLNFLSAKVNNDEEKFLFSMAVTKFINLEQSDEYICCLESWLITTPDMNITVRPSDSDNRKEVVMISRRTRDGENDFITYDIHRRDDASGYIDEPDINGAQNLDVGLFSNLFNIEPLRRTTYSERIQIDRMIEQIRAAEAEEAASRV